MQFEKRWTTTGGITKPGEIYREFVEYCYKQNLVIKNKMKIEDTANNSGKLVDLKNFDMPFLNVIVEKDDLIAPASVVYS